MALVVGGVVFKTIGGILLIVFLTGFFLAWRLLRR